MNDLEDRLNKIDKTLALPLMGKEKLIRCGQCLSGLNLTALSSKMRQALESHMSKSNYILQDYEIETWDDYDKISDADMAKLINHMAMMSAKLQALVAKKINSCKLLHHDAKMP